MSALRSISTRRLLLICALSVVALAGITAAALAATSGDGPKPPPKPLANAVQDALNAPAVPGISARIEFTNDLVDASSIQGADPLLAGASGRLWASPDDGGQLRLELQSEDGVGGGDTQLLVDGRRFQLYDGSSETVYQGTLPEEEGHGQGAEQVPGLGEIETEITKAKQHADISGATPTDVAGQPTYTVRVAPKHDGGLFGAVELAWSADNGVPLRGAVYSSDSSAPVLQLQATDVAFEAIPASTFDEVSVPAGAKVVDLDPEAELGDHHGEPKEIVGEAAVAAAVDFGLVAPESLAGLPRGEVRAIQVDGESAALVTYGEGLGGIAVIESKTEPGQGGEEPSGDVALPKVSINGVQGQELDTALGTVLGFSRDGVDYVVLGSVPPAAAEAAARAL